MLSLEKNKAGIIGHQNIINLLQSQVDNDSLNHAYLFVGQAKLGKTLVAEKFSQYIFCKNKSISKGLKACDNCTECLRFKNGWHPDLFFIKRQTDKKNIVIEQILELQQSLSLKSSGGNYKIIILEDAHNLNKEAANRLLKVLEEPYERTIFILTVDNLHNVLPTIRSRCQIIKFYPIAYEVLDDYLKKNITEEDKRVEMISLAEGKPGQVIDFLDNPKIFEQKKTFVENIIHLFTANYSENYKFLQKEIKNKLYNEKLESLMKIIQILFILLGDIYYLKNNLSDHLRFQCFKQSLKSIASDIPDNKLRNLQNSLLEFIKNSDYNPDLNLITNKISLIMRFNF